MEKIGQVIFLENKKYVLIPKWKNNPNFFRTANDPHLGRSFINPQFVQKLMNFGEVLLNEKANRKPNSGENLYLAALQLDQGNSTFKGGVLTSNNPYYHKILWNLEMNISNILTLCSRYFGRSHVTRCRTFQHKSCYRRLCCMLDIYYRISNVCW